MKHSIYALGAVILMAICLASTAQAAAFDTVNNTGLLIWDLSDSGETVYPFQEMAFFASYYNLTSGGLISGTCQFSQDSAGSWSGWENMAATPWTDPYSGITINAYLIEREMVHSGDHTFKVKCSASGFEAMELEDSFRIYNLPESACSVDIYDLTVDGTTIKGKVKNTGTWTNLANYTLFVNDEQVHTAEVRLDAGEVFSMNYNYGFDSGKYGGEYQIRLQAETPCGAEAGQEMEHIVKTAYTCMNPLGIEGEERCDYQNKRVMLCKDGGWEILSKGYDYCTSCGDRSYCGQRYNKETWQGCGEEEGCGLEISSFTYSNHILEGSRGEAIVNVKNTGIDEERFYIRFYLDGEETGFRKVDVDSGDSIERIFSYYPSGGDHTLEIEVETNCGLQAAREAHINVYPKVQMSWAETNPAQEKLETQVTVSPKSLDIPMYQAKAVSLRLESSRPQTFTVSVSGVPEEWLSYHLETDVDRRETSYIYITPREMGTYTLEIAVEALDEGLDFQEEVELYVAEPLPEEESWVLNTTRTVKSAFGYVLGDPAVSFGLMLVVFLIIVGAGFRHLREPDILE